MNGTVTAIFYHKGFCFLLGEDNLTRFAHVRDFVDQRQFDLLRNGDVVEFIPMDLNNTRQIIRGNGLRAVDIRVKNNVVT